MFWSLIQGLGVLIGLIAIALIAVRLLNPLPPLEPRPESHRLTDTGDTRLGRGVSELRTGHGDLSGIHMLVDGGEAFAARVLLARAATRSLDVQYYIWHKDRSGTLLLDALLDAAERGVRVRMLLDDNGIAGMDAVLAALDRHPNIEVRLFNPFVVRSPKMLGYLTDFTRLNRRMHNKSFVADGQAAIIGGRNIGDEYFSSADGLVFADVDVLAIGPVVDEVSADFDRYWASLSAYPAFRILPAPERSAEALLAPEQTMAGGQGVTEAYLAAVGAASFIDEVVAGTLPFEWAQVRMVSDDPAKGIGRGEPDGLLMHALREAVGEPRDEVRLVSGYFVPTQAGVEALGGFAEDGVSVAVFTNGFAASDVWVVHAGYAPYRRALLEKGVRLFEMRGPPGGETQRRIATVGSGSGIASEGGPVLRSAATTLHAKTFAVDRERLFIGSFNFDPRSIHLNTELGFLIRSPRLATAVSDRFTTRIPGNAYEVVLTGERALNWIERRDGREIIHDQEPGMTRLQRTGLWLLSHLPIEWLL